MNINKKIVWAFALLLLSCASAPEKKAAQKIVPAEEIPQEEKMDFEAALRQAKSKAQNSLLKDILNFETLSDLHYAAGWGPVALVSHYIGTDQVEVHDSAERTPLLLAASSNDSEVLEYLLQQGASLEAANYAGSRPIHLAAGFNSDVKVLEKLIAAGADVNKANNLGSSPLHWAAGAAALPQVQLLLENGAQLQATDNLGRTALDVAQRFPARTAGQKEQEAVVAYLQARK